MRINMDNNFKDLEPEVYVPDRIKREILGNLGTTKTILEVIDLFVIKAGQTFSTSFSPSTQSIKELLEGDFFDSESV